MAEDWQNELAGSTPAPVAAEMPEIKLFGRWSCDEVQVSDISLTDYIPVKEKYAKYLPHSSGRYQVKRFRKAQCPIVERITNSMMMHGRNNGKKLLTMRIIKHAFEIIHLLTGENPLQVLVNAIINSGPREDSTRIGRAGTVRRQAVDVSPLRRVNQAICAFIGMSHDYDLTNKTTTTLVTTRNPGPQALTITQTTQPQPQSQPYYPQPQGYNQQPPHQGYLPPQQGYAPPPQQGYAPSPQGYAPPPQQGYAPPLQGTAPPVESNSPPQTYPQQPAYNPYNQPNQQQPPPYTASELPPKKS